MSDVTHQKGDPEYVEEAAVTPAAPLTKGQRFKRHCARRWWIWLIGVLLFIVVLVIIIIFAIVPAVAQRTIDKTKLNIESLVILDPKPDQFIFSVDSYIDGTSKVAHDADIDPFTVEFSLNGDKPFMLLPLDGVHGGDQIPVTKSNYTTKIADLTSFGKFAGTLMDSQEFTLNIRGETKIRLGKLSPKVKYREDVTLKGFNKLNGMVITSYEILQDEGEYNLGGLVLIPNPTVFTLEVGDVYLDIDLDGANLGSGIIPNLTIIPGQKNTYKFFAAVEPNDILKLAGKIAAGTAVLSVKATAVKANDVDIPWLARPLGAVTISVPVNTTFLSGEDEE